MQAAAPASFSSAPGFWNAESRSTACPSRSAEAATVCEWGCGAGRRGPSKWSRRCWESRSGDAARCCKFRRRSRRSACAIARGRGHESSPPSLRARLRAADFLRRRRMLARPMDRRERNPESRSDHRAAEDPMTRRQRKIAARLRRNPTGRKLRRLQWRAQGGNRPVWRAF